MEKYYLTGELQLTSIDSAKKSLELLKEIVPDDPWQFPNKEQIDMHTIKCTYNDATNYGYDIFDDLQKLCEIAKEHKGFNVYAKITYTGDYEGIILIKNNVFNEYGLDTAATIIENALNQCQNAEARYRETIRSYYNDHTEEGQIAKKAKMREDEALMHDILSISNEKLYEIYNEEYAAKYVKNGKVL